MPTGVSFEPGEMSSLAGRDSANDRLWGLRAPMYRAAYERTKGQRLTYLIEYNACYYAISREGDLLAEGAAPMRPSLSEELQAIAQLSVAKFAIENLFGMSGE